MTNLEGRVILRQRVRPPPPGVRTDLDMMRALAERLGVGRAFAFRRARATRSTSSARRRRAPGPTTAASPTRGSAREQGVFWPCPDAEHPGHAAPVRGALRAPRAAARASTPWPTAPAAELPDAAYPLYFTTGRYREHYNSGAQTRRVGALRRRAAPAAAADASAPRGDARRRGGRRRARREPARSDRVRGHVSRRTSGPTRCSRRSTGAASGPPTCSPSPALDPTSRMPEFKVCAVRARAATAQGVGVVMTQEAARHRGQRHGDVPPARRARRCAGRAQRYDITVFGEEKGGAYNRILLGRVLAGEAPDAIVTKPPSWYERHGVRLVDGHRRSSALDTRARASRRPTARRHRYDVARPRDGQPAARARHRGHDGSRRRAAPRRLRLPHDRRLPAPARAGARGRQRDRRRRRAARARGRQGALGRGPARDHRRRRADPDAGPARRDGGRDALPADRALRHLRADRQDRRGGRTVGRR